MWRKKGRSGYIEQILGCVNKPVKFIVRSVARGDKAQAAKEQSMQLGDAISSPPGDDQGLVGDLQGWINIAMAKESFGKVCEHARFEFEAGSCRAGEVDCFSMLMSRRLKIAFDRLGQPGTGDRCDPKIWRTG